MQHPTWDHLQNRCSLMRPSLCRNPRPLTFFPILDLAISIGPPTHLYTARMTMVNGNISFSTFRLKEWSPSSASCPTATNVTAFCVKSHLIFGTLDFLHLLAHFILLCQRDPLMNCWSLRMCSRIQSRRYIMLRNSYDTTPGVWRNPLMSKPTSQLSLSAFSPTLARVV